jgi:phospholipase C
MLHNNLSAESKKSDPIKHVIHLMMENSSFARSLGALQRDKPDIDGVDEKAPHFNQDDKGNKIYQKSTTEKQMELDPMHEVPNVHTQLEKDNSGFVKDFVSHYPDSSNETRQKVMSYYAAEFLPALYALGKEFTVCDKWFSSVPGPTWTNRFFASSGTSMGRVIMPEVSRDPEVIEMFYQRQDTVFDRLSEKKISWRIYCGDFPVSLVFSHNRRPKNLIHFHDMDDFYKDVKGPADKFPAFTFIEPQYMGKDQNDDHPPHNTMRAQKLIADVYNAIRANEELWKQTLLVVNYDEHGGFYDHVVPPAAVPPDAHQEEYDFNQLGVRVPAILISPWAKKSVEHTIFDHTSMLKYLTDKWDLGPLGERTKQANSIAVGLDFESAPRENCLASITIPNDKLLSEKSFLEKHDVNANHEAIHLFAEYLNKKHSLFSPVKVARINDFKDRVGEKFERCGLTNLGSWLRSSADHRRQQRIERTLKIFKTLKKSAIENEEKEDHKINVNNSM